MMMGLFEHARDAAENASGASVVSAAAISASTYHFNTAVSAAGFVLTLVYLWGAMPRFWRTTVAFKRWIINRDRTLWDALGNKPQIEKED